MKHRVNLVIITIASMLLLTSTAHAKKCTVTGTVESIQLGNHTFSSINNAEADTYNVQYTELSVKLTHSARKISTRHDIPCKKFPVDSTINIGLCEQQTVKVGDIITGETDGWKDGPPCLVNIKLNQ